MKRVYGLSVVSGPFCAAALMFLCCSVAEAQARDTVLGVRLNPEVISIVEEIESKTHKPLLAMFAELEEFQLGSSFIDDDTGTATVYVDSTLENESKRLEAVITHELLHLELRVNNYPTFIFSPSVRTAKGRRLMWNRGI